MNKYIKPTLLTLCLAFWLMYPYVSAAALSSFSPRLTTKLQKSFSPGLSLPLPVRGVITRIEQTLANNQQTQVQVAYNPTNGEYLLVWQDERNGNWDIYGQRIDGNGVLVGENLAIYTGSYTQDLPQVAFGNNSYLVTWRHYTSATVFEARGQFLEPTGLPKSGSSSFTFSSAFKTDHTSHIVTDMAFNSSINKFLVVGNSLLSGQTQGWYQHVYFNSLVVQEAQLYLSSGTQKLQVAYKPAGNYFLTWQTIYGGFGLYRISGATLTSGLTLSSSLVIYTSSTNNLIDYDVAFISSINRYVVVWQDDRNLGSTGWDIYAQKVTTTPALEGANYVVSAHSANEYAPAVDPKGESVLWHRYNKVTLAHDIYGVQFSYGVPSTVPTLLVELAGNQQFPAVVSDANGRYLMAWQDNRLGTTHIFARLWSSEFLTGAFPVNPAAGNQQYIQIAYNPDDQQYLAVWQDNRSGVWAIYGQLFNRYGEMINHNGETVGSNFVIASDVSLQRTRPYVAYGGGKYLVAWSHYTTASVFDAYAQMLLPDGQLSGSPLVVDNDAGTGNDEAPRKVVYNSVSQKFLVVWDDSVSGYWNVVGRHVLLNGTVEAKIQITPTGSPHENVEDIAYNPNLNQYLLTWRRRTTSTSSSSLYTQKVSATGTIFSSVYVASTTANPQQVTAVYRPTQNDFLVAWRDERNLATTGADIYAQKITAAGALSGSNYVLVNPSGTDEWPRLIKNSQNEIVLVWGQYSAVKHQAVNSVGQLTGAVTQLLDSSYSPAQMALAGEAAPNLLLGWMNNNTQDMYVSPLFHHVWDISKTAPAEMEVGLPITYTLTVTNYGDLTLAGTITDSLPAGATYVSGGTLEGTTVEWNSDYIWPGQLVTVSFTVTANQTLVNNSYGVRNKTGHILLSNEPITTTALYRGLTISKTAPAEMEAGLPITYTITVVNSGDITFTAGQITDTLPVGATYVSGGTLNGQEVSWPLSVPFPPGAETQVQFVVTAPQTIINNNYGVNDGAEYVVVSNEPVTTTALYRDFTISKTAPAEMEAGLPITYTITVVNSGDITFTAGQITDTLPVGATYVSGGTRNGQEISWPLPVPFPPGAETQVQFVVTAPQTIINNNYGVNDGAEYVVVSNEPVVTTALYRGFTISKMAPAEVETGEEIVYTLTITNSGDITFTAGQITDTLPVGATYVSGGTLNGQEISWPLPIPFSPGEVTQVQFSVTATQTITNSDYGVSDGEEYVVVSNEPVVTLIPNWVIGEAELAHYFGEYALAHDGTQLILYGGNATGWPYSNLTWVYNNTSWITITGAITPSARYGMDGEYNPALGRVVLFGGANEQDIPLDETWLYSPLTTSWIITTSPITPSARINHDLAVVSPTVYLFGGNNGATYFNDLWQFDENGWSEIVVTGDKPLARTKHSLVGTLSGLWLFGGRAADGTLLNDLWYFDLFTQSWTEITSFGLWPMPRMAHAMAYDPGRDVLLLIGGQGQTTPLADLWFYSPVNEQWSLINTALDLPAVANQAAVANPTPQTVINGRVWEYR